MQSYDKPRTLPRAWQEMPCELNQSVFKLSSIDIPLIEGKFLASTFSAGKQVSRCPSILL